jgi:hypothetical protein
LQRATDTSLVSPIVGATPVFTLESSADETTANALLGIQQGDVTLSVKFSGPVRKGSTTAFAGLDGLHNKASVDFGVGYLHWTVEDPGPALKPACERLAAIQNKQLNEVDCSLQNLRRVSKDTGEPLVPRIDPGNAYFFTGRVKAAREDFEFVDSISYAAAEPATRTSSSYQVAVGWLTSGNWVLGANFRHEKTYAAGSDPTEICRTVATGITSCDQAVVGEPTFAAADLYQVEVRRFLSAHLAINPRLTRRVSPRVTAFDLPLYFIANSDGGLTGGVNVGWRSDRPGPALTVFVGQVLRLFTR